ncbi:MAG TPA: MerR family transcriptional regulator [Allosphingosinicella sp.]|jgi:DNA-binding transcriptional MerR regulator|nr:MerR family transcriptional regulator [Allosphingosinicella sp.]
MAAQAPGKSDQAFRTIGELAGELGVPQHILRYWETRFPQLKPLQRAGNRRYYRPADVELARRIHRLLNEQGYTIRGVQQLLAGRGGGEEEGAVAPVSAPAPAAAPAPQAASGVSIEDLKALRRTLSEALELART